MRGKEAKEGLGHPLRGVTNLNFLQGKNESERTPPLRQGRTKGKRWNCTTVCLNLRDNKWNGLKKKRIKGCQRRGQSRKRTLCFSPKNCKKS